MSDKMREEFEAWAKRHHGVYSIGSVCAHYSNENVQRDWIIWCLAWQASRASVVVKLPITVCRTHVFELPHTHEVGMEHDEYFEVDDIKKSLAAAGVSYK